MHPDWLVSRRVLGMEQDAPLRSREGNESKHRDEFIDEVHLLAAELQTRPSAQGVVKSPALKSAGVADTPSKSLLPCFASIRVTQLLLEPVRDISSPTTTTTTTHSLQDILRAY